MKQFRQDSHIPLYRQLEHFLIDQMRKGIYKNGSPLPSINDLDRKLHLGRVTIVQAMKVLTEDGYAISKHGKGYYARIPENDDLVGVVAPFHSAHMDIYSNLLAGLRNAGINNTFISSDEDPKIFRHSVNEFIDYRGLSRLIVVPPWNRNHHVRESVERFLLNLKEQRGIEIIVADREVEVDLLQVHQDYRAGVKLLLQRAVKTGCRKIIVFTDTLRKTKKAYSLLLEKKFCILNVVFKQRVTPQEDLATVYSEKPDAVFANDDIHARLLIKLAAGKAEFNLAGYNGTPSAFSIKPMITTINTNLASVGIIASDYFFEGKYSSKDKIKLNPFIMPGDTF